MDTRLAFLSPSLDKPSYFVDVDAEGLIVNRGPFLTHIPPAPFEGKTILIVPGTEVRTRWLELDDAAPARAVEEAAAILKDEIGAPRDKVHIALGNVEDDGTTLVSVIDRQLMREFLSRAAELGISAGVVIPDHLMLPSPSDGVLTVACNKIMVVRGHRVAFTAEAELASMLIGSRRRTSIESEGEAELLFAECSLTIAMNLLQQDFASASRQAAWAGFRRAAALAAIAALSPLAIWTAEIARNEASATALETRAQEVARTMLGNKQSLDPIRELGSRAAALQANGQFMRSTAVLFETMARIDGVELESLSYLDEGIIRATLVQAAGANARALSDALEQSGIAVDQDAAVERDGRTVTTITLRGRS
jgi:general secretion pathway protein L